MTIRNARKEDAQAIAAIYAHHVWHGTGTFDTLPLSPAAIEAKITDCIARGWPFLTVDIDGALAGYAYAAQLRDRTAYAFACEDSIYVHPDHVGQGVGKALLGALLPAAQAAGFSQMIAVIGDAQPASVALHASLGFRHTGRMQSVGRKFGRWLDTVYMQIALGAGDSTAPTWEP